MYFALELDSQKIAALTSLNRNTINRYLTRIRCRMVELCEDQARAAACGPMATTVRQVAARASRSLPDAPSSMPVFGIQSRNAHIYTEILSNGIHRTLRRLIKKDTGSAPITIPEDCLHYDGIVDLNSRWHYSLDLGSAKKRLAGGAQEQILQFLGFARKRLTTINLNGADHFGLLLKECEYRFNNQGDDIYHLLLKRFRERPMS